MAATVVIPARYGSSRFPGKPMALVAGRSLLHRTYAIAKAVDNVAGVYVATDDERIAKHAQGFGAAVLMTSSQCRTGTDRVFEAAKMLDLRPDAVINLQGDAVLTPPWVVQAMVDAFHAQANLALVTPAVRLSLAQWAELKEMKARAPSSGTLVTFDRQGDALYFSKAIIPFLRDPGQDPPPLYRHIGIYGYAFDTLVRLSGLDETPLEKAEQLEQLRALENRIPIRVVLVDYRGRTHWSVDVPADIGKVEEIIAREGELVAVQI